MASRQKQKRRKNQRAHQWTAAADIDPDDLRAEGYVPPKEYESVFDRPVIGKILAVLCFGPVWICYFLIVYGVKLYRFVMPTALTPIAWRRIEDRPSSYRWEDSPALQTFLDWELRPALAQIEDEAAGKVRPKCYATATRTIKNTMGLCMGRRDYDIPKGATVEIVIGSAMGDLCIREHNDKPIGNGCYGYTQRVAEDGAELVDFRATPAMRSVDDD